MINIGIIGMGGIARLLHIPQMQSSGKFTVRAAADIRPDDGSAANMGIQNYYTDYKKLLADPEIDAVLISTTHDLHREHCCAAFEAGKHVIVEKPIARNLVESAQILEAADKAGTTFMVGFCERFDPGHVYIKNILSGGKIGRLLSARIDHYQNFNPAPGSWWRSTEKVGGGAVIGSGVHRLDLLRWYFGEPIRVYAEGIGMPERLEAEACVHAVIAFDSGVVADFSINWAAVSYLYYEGLSVTGTDGALVKQDGMLKLGLGSVDGGVLKDAEAPGCPTMYEHFAHCIETGETPFTNGKEGHETLRLVRAIYKSLKSGEVVIPKDVKI